MSDHWGKWDEEPVGHGYKNPSRFWNRGVYQYFAIVVGMIGGFMTLGALLHFSLVGLVGGVCVLAAPLLFGRCDRAARKRQDGSRYLPWRTELLWLLGAWALVIVGVTVTALS